MLSKKLTFSLTSLFILLAIGFIVVPYGIAHESAEIVLANGDKIKVNPTHPKPMLSVASDKDISSADGVQVMRPAAGTNTIMVLIDVNTLVDVPGDLAADDVTIRAYDEDGIPVLAPDEITISDGNPNTGKNAILTIAETGTADDDPSWANIDTLYVSIPEKAFKNADASLNPHEKGHADSVASNVLVITLVDADDGDAKYNLPGAASDYTVDVGAGVPGVISITRTLDPSGFAQAASGPFEIRVILTEQPKEFTAAHIVVDGGTATVGAPAMGLPIKEDEFTALIAGGGYVATDSDLLPDPTGRDDMYHQYSVMITPESGFDGSLTISVAQFEDMVLPISKKYVPLSKAQRLDTTVTSDERAARITDGREVLTVRVHTIEDAKVSSAKAAYDDRQKVYDANPAIKVLDAKLVVPAGGFLVLAKGKTDSDPISGVQNVSMKTKEKKTAAQQLYNVKYEFGLPFPADDLDNFFRNGGTLTLAYADIAAATGSGHADSKGPTGDDATGYTAATTNAYAARTLIINEIMWGLDGNSANGQYIEIHNPGTAAIGLDAKEWAIVVGSAPAGFTAIDTVSNNPASGYWQVPGNGGVTAVKPEFPAVSDLVSMSRLTDGTDGTAAASWAASERPSENLIGRRIGTPGAANNPSSAPAPPPAPAPEPAPMAPVATASDLMISEIMVASNDGRLPQWIEIANVSGSEVSLSGWKVDIDNDAADADVVGKSVTIALGDVTVGKDQVVLVVSKTTTRNSGVGMGKGDIREDRLVDAQMQVSPTDARYSMISEMAFQISLLPPQPAAGVVDRGDIVGNLGMGWEIPMAEGNRSSIIRNEMGKAGEIMGTDAAGWVLASSTELDGAYRTTYYGDDEDEGTPGYDAGGALPVELSKFDAKRDRVTGQVTITWETQSELNNAGFFVKRSQQRNGQFVVVNPTMIQGAGTTSEKQSYTYTDTTAKPNIVYYYQIEDVSLDGNRQTLTRGHRLKGHIGAAGKATTTWGDLKTSREQ